MGVPRAGWRRGAQPLQDSDGTSPVNDVLEGLLTLRQRQNQVLRAFCE